MRFRVLLACSFGVFSRSGKSRSESFEVLLGVFSRSAELCSVFLKSCLVFSRSVGVVLGVFLKSCSESFQSWRSLAQSSFEVGRVLSESSRDLRSRAWSLLEVVFGIFSRAFGVVSGVFLKSPLESLESLWSPFVRRRFLSLFEIAGFSSGSSRSALEALRRWGGACVEVL